MITKSEVERELKFAKDPEKQIRIIAELNCTTVKAVLNLLDGDEHHLPKRSRCAAQRDHCWTETELDKLVEMYNQGCSLRSIAISLGFASDTAIRNAINKHIRGKRDDIVLRTRGWSEDDMKTAAEMRRNGAAYDEIGEKFGRNTTCVYQMLRKHMADFDQYADKGGQRSNGYT